MFILLFTFVSILVFTFVGLFCFLLLFFFGNLAGACCAVRLIENLDPQLLSKCCVGTVNLLQTFLGGLTENGTKFRNINLTQYNSKNITFVRYKKSKFQKYKSINSSL